MSSPDPHNRSTCFCIINLDKNRRMYLRRIKHVYVLRRTYPDVTRAAQSESLSVSES